MPEYRSYNCNHYRLTTIILITIDNRQVSAVIQRLEDQLGTLGVSSLTLEDTREVMTEATLQEEVDALLRQVTDGSREK